MNRTSILCRNRFVESGISSFELVISLAISTPLLACLAVMLHGSVRAVTAITRTKGEIQTFLITRNHLVRGMQSLDDHRLAPAPRIHDRGTLRYTDATLNTATSGSHRPDPLSTAISFLELEREAQCTIESVTAGSFVHDVRCCSSHGISVHEEPGSFAAISIDGMSLFRGHVTAQGGGCVNLNLIPAKSMVIEPESRLQVETLRKLIPVRREYTLYLDTEQILRYLGHRAGENIENQPLTSGIDVFSMILTPLHSEKLFLLEARLGFEEGRPKVISASHKLGRKSPFSFILVRP